MKIGRIGRPETPVTTYELSPNVEGWKDRLTRNAGNYVRDGSKGEDWKDRLTRNVGNHVRAESKGYF